MRFLGIDYGKKNIGLALTDESASFAFPSSVIINKGIDKSVEEVLSVYKKNNVSKIIIGRSIDSKGNPNPIMVDILKFKKKIEEATGIKVEFEDEFFTTREARILLSKDDNLGRRATKARLDKKNVKKVIDAEAATIILKSYIDRKKSLGGEASKW
ncbi:MAG: Holliday junction resolvase RuvX [Parcubacteria group bacterium CG10_big_fil_rev_8_21_14_0_10_38_31]|nr:MAG: Holliday junction resolvase RuvX [Parcubacteria group bacterium CG10_big_fil_rev_8_21_14_0_10_38_31]